MSNATTVLQQLLHLLPEDRFQTFVGQHGADRYVKTFSCRNQLCTLLFAQATGKDSLRGIETGLRSLDSMWYHLGLTSVARSTIAYANEHRPAAIYESLFYAMLEKCQALAPKRTFSFQNELRAIDSTTIDLCLTLFDWAHFRAAKGAIKLHTSFNVRSQIPDVIELTDGKVHDIKAMKMIDLSQYPRGTIFIVDRGYFDLALLQAIVDAGHHFVIRLKKNAHIVRIEEHRTPTGTGVLQDERIAFVLPKSQEKYPDDLRLVTYHDDEHNVTYQFLTDEFRLSAANIALIYKQRWQIELFFKWIKQHLKIKTFLGTSKNAVLTQIWVAMIYFLLLSWIAFQTHFQGSLLDLTRIVAELLVRRVHLVDSLSLTPKTIHRLKARDAPQLSLL
ncbi:MAG: IS4 family transposase [Rectinemataceae bacterium]|nr:IS4 family transposase [Rectinemataceae bacterium]